jgi:hypothetical protein
MPLEALLTFIGILLAALAIMRPVQRHALSLFVPLWGVVTALLCSLTCIIVRDAPLGVRPLFGWPLPLVTYLLTLGAFLIPVGAAAWSWVSWYRARLNRRNIARVEKVFQAALRESEFDEVERIVRKNQQRLDGLPASAVTVLFLPKMVEALINSNSFVHLELLSHKPFLESLENRFGAVEVVVRELLVSGISPLRSAIVSRFGGLEHLTYTETERALMEKTFLRPEWYSEANAHYPLTISAIEVLRTGELDAVYNGVGRSYEASQGASTRVNCRVYLAAKTEFLANEAAIKAHAKRDFYLSDLFDVFSAVRERSKFDTDIWNSDLSNAEYPTPYAYLLYEIARDLRELSGNALREATANPAHASVLASGMSYNDPILVLARTWSFCVRSIADSEAQVSPAFRNQLIKEYLLFVLALGWEPSEIFHVSIGKGSSGFDVWRDLFVKELQDRFVGESVRKKALKAAFNSLDQGKGYVFDGSSWLEEKLFS